MHGSVASLLVRVLVAVSRDRREAGAAPESVPCSRGLPEGFLPVMLLLAGAAADEEEDAPVRSMWK